MLALFVVTNDGEKSTKYPTKKGPLKLWYIHSVEYYAAVKNAAALFTDREHFLEESLTNQIWFLILDGESQD